MAMYQDLLAAFCEDEERRLRGSGVDDLVADLDRRHRSLTDGGSARTSHDPAGDLALQIAYDAILVVLGRRIGIDTGPRAFSVPGAERSRLEQILARSGLTGSPEASLGAVPHRAPGAVPPGAGGCGEL
ncbi:MAG: hypothetical protein ACYDHU_09330 [Acidimicrobiales bacterium]